MSDTYTCELCEGVFEKKWSDEDARAEKDAHFPSVPLEECGVVCDVCYKLLLGRFGGEDTA